MARDLSVGIVEISCGGRAKTLKISGRARQRISAGPGGKSST